MTERTDMIHDSTNFLTDIEVGVHHAIVTIHKIDIALHHYTYIILHLFYTYTDITPTLITTIEDDFRRFIILFAVTDVKYNILGTPFSEEYM